MGHRRQRQTETETETDREREREGKERGGERWKEREAVSGLILNLV